MNQLLHENQRLLSENQTLKQSLEELIAVNTELTESIEEFSDSNHLTERIAELETENRNIKNQLHNAIKRNDKNNKEDENSLRQENEELQQIVKDMLEKSRDSQKYYEQEIFKLTKQLEHQNNHSQQQLNQLSERIRDHEKTINELRKKNENLNVSIEEKVLKQSQKLQHEDRKSLKVSSTIEDLRNVLSGQIEEKDRIINTYENLVAKLKSKITEKF